MDPTRRQFIARVGSAGAAASLLARAQEDESPLNGTWYFRRDPRDTGESLGFHGSWTCSAGASPRSRRCAWSPVPHL